MTEGSEGRDDRRRGSGQFNRVRARGVEAGTGGDWKVRGGRDATGAGDWRGARNRSRC